MKEFTTTLIILAGQDFETVCDSYEGTVIYISCFTNYVDGRDSRFGISVSNSRRKRALEVSVTERLSRRDKK